MNKKCTSVLALLMAFAICLGLCACGGSQPPAATEAPEENTVQPAEETAAATEPPAFEQVIYDDDSLFIKVCGIREGQWEGTTEDALVLDLEVENRDTKPMTVSFMFGAINGLLSDIILGEGSFATLEPGEQRQMEALINKEKLTKFGGSGYDEIRFEIYADVENDDASFNDVVKGYPVVIRPNGEDIQLYEYQIKPGDVAVIDDEYLSIVFIEHGYGTGLRPFNDAGDYSAWCYIQNKTDKVMSYEKILTSLNGSSLYDYSIGTIRAGCSAFVVWNLGGLWLEENQVKSITSLGTRIVIYDSETNAVLADEEFLVEEK